MESSDLEPATRVVFGAGVLTRLGELARELGFSRTLIVSDPGIVATGLVAQAAASLRASAIEPYVFSAFAPNPDVTMIEAGRAYAASMVVDSIVALGGGSSLDCAKGINFVLTGGGTMRDYRGHGKAIAPMLPMIGIPTTAGTGSDAQSYAIISDPDTHAKMACGDPGAAFRIALLDPAATVSQPRALTAITGFDALSHAVESYVTTKRNEASDRLARRAWGRLHAHYERVLEAPGDLAARGEMLLGAHEAGLAIEHSMLGATHACANPLTARFGTTHGMAIALMLPHVVRWNAEVVGDRYADLLRDAGREPGGDPGEALAIKLEALARAGDLPSTLRQVGVSRDSLPALAADAATQWTGTFNPRPLDVAAAQALYERAY